MPDDNLPPGIVRRHQARRRRRLEREEATAELRSPAATEDQEERRGGGGGGEGGARPRVPLPPPRPRNAYESLEPEMSRAEIREQLNQLEYLSKRLSALQSRDEMTRKNIGEDQPFIRRSKEELEQEVDYQTLVPRTIFSPTAPTVTETTFSTGHPYHLATTAPGIGLPLPPPHRRHHHQN